MFAESGKDGYSKGVAGPVSDVGCMRNSFRSIMAIAGSRKSKMDGCEKDVWLNNPLIH